MQVFPLGDIIGDEFSAEDLLSAIEAALELADDREDGPRIRFHEETRTLLMSGTAREIGVVDSMIAAVRENIHHERAHRDVREAAAARAAERRELQRFAAQALQRLREVEHRAEQEVVSDALKGDLRRLRRELQQLHMRLRAPDRGTRVPERDSE